MEALVLSGIVQAWMTNSQFLDGLALSGILPAFLFTLVGHGFFERVVDNERFHAFLDGVTAVVVGLMAMTTLNLLKAGINDLISLGIFAVGLVVLYIWKYKLAVPIVMISSGAAGLLLL